MNAVSPTAGVQSAAAPARTPSRIAIVGASGLIGRALVTQLLADPEVRELHLLLRTPLKDLPHDTRVHQHQFDPQHADRWRPSLQVDALFCALGTTLRTAGSQAAFRAVDHELVVAIARQARLAGVQHVLVVSALGADPRSRVFYNRVKGEMEHDVGGLQLPKLSLFRPSLLTGSRREFRLGETLARSLAWSLPLRWRAIRDTTVAQAMWRACREQKERFRIYESAEMQQLGRC